MDYYLLAFVLGIVGLGVMAVGGLGHRGGGSQPGAGHAVQGHGAHGAIAHGHAGPALRTAARVQSHHTSHAQRDVAGAGRDLLLALVSPRVLFALLLGVGAAGLLFGRVLHSGLLLGVVALAAGVLFERAAVAPMWRFVERFASTPAQMLETALYDHAHAASGFDVRGEGLVVLELDGQVVQLLGRLRPEDQGFRVRAGDRLRVEAVDAERNRCTVSVAGPA
ncbi:MAG: hypothetical protein M3154_01640 [Candidatus Eremiobacteraeota bacterium]|nr:hypothetical protein [Candidatus Eremiobacteraeota bacterium]